MKIFILVTVLLFSVHTQTPSRFETTAQVLVDQAQAAPSVTETELEECNGTESYFLSPHALGRTPEVEIALDNIAGQVKVARTTFNVSGLTYIIDNVQVGVVYNPSKQNVTIPKPDEVQVSGGRFEFTYNLNYTKIENRNNITGHAYGSVLSDEITYEKDFTFCSGFLCFRLKPSQNITTDIVKNKLTLKRMEPFNETDLKNLESLLDDAKEGIQPSTVKHQILTHFNDLFPSSLNDSLNHQIFGESVNYTWSTSSHGNMTMKVVRELHGFGIDPQLGYKIVFLSKIENYDEQRCDITVPTKPGSFDLYGGTQTYQLNCFYENVIYYLQSNGWLDTTLNSDWEVSPFQFYAGDLFDLINNLYIDFSPRALLDGSCKAQKENLEFIASRQLDANTYALDTTYRCSLKGTNSQGSPSQILKFTASTKLLILAQATTKTLYFTIKEARLDNLSFETVGKYSVSNMELAKFKVTSVLKRVEGTNTFGTGFPAPTRENPKTRVDRDWVFFYDNSHIGLDVLSTI